MRSQRRNQKPVIGPREKGVVGTKRWREMIEQLKKKPGYDKPPAKEIKQ